MNRIFVFDMDDTIVESQIRFDKAVFAVLDEEGISYDEALKRVVTPLCLEQIAQFYWDRLGLKDTTENLTKRMEQKMWPLYTSVIRPKAGVPAFLQGLYERGDRLFLLTTARKSLAKACLSNNGLIDLFEQVWSADDFRYNKSDPRLFQQVAERLGCKPNEIYYFEDNPFALENAKQAGWQIYAVYNNNSQAEVAETKKSFTAFVETFEGLDL